VSSVSSTTPLEAKAGTALNANSAATTARVSARRLIVFCVLPERELRPGVARRPRGSKPAGSDPHWTQRAAFSTATSALCMEQALDLMRRLPPAKVTENLTSLVELAPHLTEELLARVDQPLQARP
jgi:hypothetical protein